MKDNLSPEMNASEMHEAPKDTAEEPGGASSQSSTENDDSFIKKTRVRLTRFLGFKNGSLEEEVADLIEEHDPEGTQMRKEERSILNNVLGLSETSVDDVMIPRTDIVAVEQDINLDELRKVIIEKQHTRIPVYKDNLDNVIGFIHIKDLLAYLGAEDSRNYSIKNILRIMLFVPPSMKVVDLLLKMQAKRVHMAIVLDEYGCTCGLVTMEDLMEEIIGDIEDEHDQTEYTEIKRFDDFSFEVNARMPVEELEKHLGVTLASPEEAEDFDTLGGMMFYLLGHIPEKGETVKHKSGIEFEVVEADARKVSKLLVRTVPQQ